RLTPTDGPRLKGALMDPHILSRVIMIVVAMLATAPQGNGDLPWDDEPDELSWEHFASCRDCFADFGTWWSTVPGEDQAAALAAIRETSLIKSPPPAFTSLLVQGQAFSGDGWQPRTVHGRNCLVGPAGHTQAVARYILDVPDAGRYRIW